MSARIMLVVYAAVGGAIGTAARYLLTLAIQERATSGFPVATLFINISGSFLLGFLMRFGLEGSTASPEFRLMLTTGLCGGFTTFSTFSYETARLLEGGEWYRGLTYIAASVVVCLAGTFVGFALARALLAAQQI
jgi:CrcB protein